MGSLAACHLQSAGMAVAVLGAAHDNLTRQLFFPQQTTPRLLTLPHDTPAVITHLLLATKAQQTGAALAPWRERLAPEATLVCLQNGMGQLDGLGLPATVRMISAITTSGAWRDRDKVQVVAENTTWLGDGNATAPAWVAPLARVWPGLEWVADIRRRQWEKLAVNAVINPLTALHDCRNGELLAAGLQDEVRALAAEVDRVLMALDPDWPCHTLARTEQVAALTAENVSSMRADVRAGRATEIDFINGWLVREAEKRHLSAPLNRRLWEQVRGLHRPSSP